MEMEKFDLLNLLTNSELGLPDYSETEASRIAIMRYNLDVHPEMKQILLERKNKKIVFFFIHSLTIMRLLIN
jgi:hypothetical protein